MAKSIGTLKAQLVLDTDQFLGGFAKAQKGASTFASLFGGIGGKLTAAFAGVASVGTVMHSLAAGMEQVDRQAKLADRLGITVGEVQRLSLAADLAGTDVELLARSMLKMGKNIGSGGQSLDKRLFQVADALAQIKDAGQRAKRAEEIFGKGGLELINVLIQGGRGIRDSASAIEKFGLELSRVDAAKVEAANDAWTEMKTILEGTRNLLLVELSPAMAGFLDVTIRGLHVIKVGLDDISTSLKSVGVTLRGTAESLLSTGLNALGVPGGAFIAGKAGSMFRELEALGNARAGGVKLPLGASVLGGGTGRGVGGFGAEKGSLEAARIITNAGGNPLEKAQLDAMKEVAEHTRRMEEALKRRHIGGAAVRRMGI